MKAMPFLPITTAWAMRYFSSVSLVEVCSNTRDITGNPVVDITHRFAAFTARSIAGMVGDLGLLTKAGLPSLAEVFLDFENRLNPRYRPVLRNVPFPNKPSAGNPLYREELERVQ